MNDKEKLILEIEKWCECHQITQTRFALILGVDKTQWSYTRKKYKSVSRDIFQKLMLFFKARNEGHMIKLLVEYMSPLPWNELKDIVECAEFNKVERE